MEVRAYTVHSQAQDTYSLCTELVGSITLYLQCPLRVSDPRNLAQHPNIRQCDKDYI